MLYLKKSQDETLAFYKTIKQIKFIGANGRTVILNTSDAEIRNHLTSSNGVSMPCFSFQSSSASVKSAIAAGTLAESERTSKYLDGYYNLARIEFS